MCIRDRPYLKVRQADAIAEIKAVLAADDIGQQGLQLNGEEGNPDVYKRQAYGGASSQR